MLRILNTEVTNSQSMTVMGEIKSRFDSIEIWIATKIQFKHCAIRFKYHAIWYWSIQILTIRFKRHAIWTEISKSWLKLNTHSHYSLISQILSSNVWFYPSLMHARNNSLSVIIRGGFERRDQCTYKRCYENGNSNGLYHWPEPIKLKYIQLYSHIICSTKYYERR